MATKKDKESTISVTYDPWQNSFHYSTPPGTTARELKAFMENLDATGKLEQIVKESRAAAPEIRPGVPLPPLG